MPKNIYLYATKFYYIIRSFGARAEVFPLHPGAVSLAQTEVTSGRRSCLGAPRTAEAPDIPAGRSQYYLPTIRAAVAALFSWFFAPWRRAKESRSFITGKPEFHGRKVGVCWALRRVGNDRDVSCQVISRSVWALALQCDSYSFENMPSPYRTRYRVTLYIIYILYIK